jgi:protein tyrosine/serine phosphatase
VQSRELVWDGCVNVRDLGGLPTETGGVTRFGVVVRADNVRGLSEAGWDALAEYGIGRIVDLRWQFEVEEDPPGRLDFDVVHVPVLESLDRITPVEELTAGIDDPVEWRTVTYRQFLERFPHRFGEAITAVAETRDGCVLVHCAGGVDRTGLVAALLLRVAGVGIDDVAADFALSERGWAPSLPQWLAEAPDGEERRRRERLGQIRAESMAAVLDGVDAVGYLRAAGVAEGSLARIRERLVG